MARLAAGRGLTRSRAARREAARSRGGVAPAVYDLFRKKAVGPAPKRSIEYISKRKSVSQKHPRAVCGAVDAACQQGWRSHGIGQCEALSNLQTFAHASRQNVRRQLAMVSAISRPRIVNLHNYSTSLRRISRQPPPEIDLATACLLLLSKFLEIKLTKCPADRTRQPGVERPLGAAERVGRWLPGTSPGTTAGRLVQGRYMRCVDAIPVGGREFQLGIGHPGPRLTLGFRLSTSLRPE